MGEHSRYLDKFLRLFRSINLDRSGVINEDDFWELVSKMGIIPDTLFQKPFRNTHSDNILF